MAEDNVVLELQEVAEVVNLELTDQLETVDLTILEPQGRPGEKGDQGEPGEPGEQGPPGSSGGSIARESLAPAPDGVNRGFSITGTFVLESDIAIRNGLFQMPEVEYTAVTTSSIQFTDAPLVGDDLFLIYSPA